MYYALLGEQSSGSPFAKNGTYALRKWVGDMGGLDLTRQVPEGQEV